MIDAIFRPPSGQPLDLLETEIHVWKAALSCEESTLQRLEAMLSTDELERANRFFALRDRSNFVAARGILRDLLGKYSNRAPGELEFSYSPKGKPSLRTELQNAPIRFNISHSHGLALLAFAANRELGVDVEWIRPNVAFEEIAKRYFSPLEVTELKSLDPALRAVGFFQCWTRKESYIKAKGEGLHIPLESFSVTLTPGHAAELNSADSLQWKLQSIDLDEEGFVGAMVAEGKDWQPCFWNWSPDL
jgi:4'-phosphopantetheinyl transferase